MFFARAGWLVTLLTFEQPKRIQTQSWLSISPRIPQRKFYQWTRRLCSGKHKFQRSVLKQYFAVSLLIFQTLNSKAKYQITMLCLRTWGAILFQWKQWIFHGFAAWFQQRDEFHKTILKKGTGKTSSKLYLVFLQENVADFSTMAVRFYTRGRIMRLWPFLSNSRIICLFELGQTFCSSSGYVSRV